MRLDKFLCSCLAVTRSEAKKIIKKGVLVNRTLVKDPNIKINEEFDKIIVNDKELTYSKYVYFMLNKPQGVITATKDNKDKTVLDLLSVEDKIKDPFPVGRLDKDTEGLLLITNDGDLAHNLLSPKKDIWKKYYVEVDGFLTADIVGQFARGITLQDGYICKKAILELQECSEILSSAFINITEGKFHQIKRMMNAVALNVTYLKRVSMGDLVLDSNLILGEYRHLTDEEIKNLYKRG